MENAKAYAQADRLDEAARLLKRGQNATREALHIVRQVQTELNGIKVETAEPQEAQHGSQEISRAA